MAQVTETSVMFALADLQRTEVLRQREEADEEAQRLKEQKEREQRAREQQREAELQAQRVAEAAARLRVDIEARESAARERVAAMQQALIQIKAERDVLQEHLQAKNPPATAEPGPAAAVRWAMGGMALSLTAVVAMAIVLLGQPVRARTREGFSAPTPATVRASLPQPQVQPQVAPPPSTPEPRAVVKPAAVAVHPKPGRHTPTRPQEPSSPEGRDCGDDPLCGMKFYK